MSISSVSNIILALGIFIWFIYRQVRVRQVRDSLLVYIIILLLGLYMIVSAVEANKVEFDLKSILICTISFSILAPGFGVIRASVARIWKQDGIAMCQGSWITVILWLVGFGIHNLLDSMFRGSSVTIAAYLAISLLVQRYVVYQRSLRLL